jgi:hypothetical protein
MKSYQFVIIRHPRLSRYKRVQVVLDARNLPDSLLPYPSRITPYSRIPKPYSLLPKWESYLITVPW